MPLITVWNSVRVRTDIEPLQRSMLKRAFRKECLAIPELGLTTPEQVTVRFPDLTDETPDPGDPIIVIVELLFDRPKRTLEVRRKLAVMLATAMRQFPTLQDRPIEVAVKRFDPDRDAFFSMQ